ncbi:universal stress protein [Corynebacterium testudinoris]|uniref:Universal stress protein UspA-like protein n=1 Tax=Corynebacterium testudinoris TaxID=136857 RepID=A0A0G3H4C5_9CORY|nr:universal stress protein [Corynebacterium testudinoris]AKK08241.1 universal stress protein UspA-like protein [Corynebacterium testudinoris]MBX8995685.1 universal stress protein [Corynebacterium testudinoris]
MRTPKGRFLVGYVATHFGRDALNLAISLAQGRDVHIDIVMVVPVDNAYSGIYPHDRGYASIVEEQMAQWLQDALDRVPEGISATGRIVAGESEAETLHRTALDLGADLIVVGARDGAILSRFRVGSVANALLHSSSVPVALAPAGFDYTGPTTRFTAMFGSRPGAPDVVGLAVDRARRRGVPLRLASLVLSDATVLDDVRALGDARLTELAGEMVESGAATTIIAAGESIEQAMQQLDWQQGDVVVAGSSRMAANGRIFIGTTAAKILRTIPVPMLVVPAGYIYDEGGETP